MSQISISVEKLSYWYGDLKAVNQISFEVGQGEILGFLGPNGAGKTTTQKMLTSQLKPKNGRATLLGFDVAKDTEEIHRWDLMWLKIPRKSTGG
ncbi:ATP-binding cassette domain-containing protein [Dehalococcoides mccartyi]|uniref:ATP-binding cassette domain-containing protein n=1 Tax=Dehalococcoides mccartyi TaxID=61435 RepID=UPI000A5D0026|nr:ATP-binding cassette domain-containing protein [Dehalococcoides mccartyi]